MARDLTRQLGDRQRGTVRGRGRQQRARGEGDSAGGADSEQMAPGP
jgi:hypothetical protein